MKKLILICTFSLLVIFSQNALSKPLKLYYRFSDQYIPVGSGSLVGKSGHILTVAHLITKKRAKEGCSIKEQLKEISDRGGIFLSSKIICTNPDTNREFVDGAILIPLKAFQWEVIDPYIEAISIPKCRDCLDNSYLFGSKSGFKSNIIKHLSNKSLRPGDSGSVIVNNANNEALAVFYGHGSTIINKQEGYPTSYFFTLDKKQEGLIAVIRTMPGKVELRSIIPPGCKRYL